MTTHQQATLREGLHILGGALRQEPAVLGLAVTGSAMYGVATVAAAEVIGRVTDRVIVPAFATGEVATGTLWLAALAIVAVALVKSTGIVTRRFFAGLGQYRLNAHYRRLVSRQYLRLPMAWHHQHSTGQLLSNANADVEAVFWPIAPLPFALGVIVMLAVALVSMFLADPWLALVGSLVFPAVVVVNFFYQRQLSPLATRAQALRAELSGVAHESFDGATVVKAMGREAEETERFARFANALRDANVGVGRVRGAFDPLMEALPQLGVLAVLLIGSARVAGETLEPGTLVQVAYLLTTTAFPIRAIGFVLGELPRSVVGWRRVSAVLDATGALEYGNSRLDDNSGGRGVSDGSARDSGVSDGSARDSGVSDGSARDSGVSDGSARDGGVRDGSPTAIRLGVRDVDFSYGDDTDVLRGLTFDVEAGRTIALVGSTGAGKSTLASMLARLIDPMSGAILLDGVDARHLRPGEIANAVALVFQQPFIFEDTVRDNVTVGGEISDEDVWSALRLAQAEGFVRGLGGTVAGPDVLNARIGERGATLSGGQRQRLALARALARKPRLLVLDDATSAVDPEVEQRILTGLRNASLPSTVVVVAHRRATIAMADEVLYLDGGRILARGSHEELLLTSPGYRELITAYERDAAERAAAPSTAAEDDTQVTGQVQA